MNYMTAIALDSETRNYWEQIKSASSKAKLTLITLLSASMADEEGMVITRRPSKVHRLSTMTDEQMELEMQGEATPIMIEEEAIPADIVKANSGRISEGLEKWL